MVINWTQVLTEAVITVIPIVGSLLLYLWKRSETAKKEQDRRHGENKEAIGAVAKQVAELQTAEQYMPQHFHQEFYTSNDDDEPLTLGNIIRKPNGQKSR